MLQNVLQIYEEVIMNSKAEDIFGQNLIETRIVTYYRL